MFGSNGPFSPTDYIPQYASLDPIFHPGGLQQQPQQQQCMGAFVDSDSPDCHSSAPPTPDIISGIISLTGGLPSPSDMSSGGSFADMPSPDEYHSGSSPPSSCAVDVSTVKATRSKLIKEGLKLTIQSRRMIHGLDNVRPEYRMPLHEELTKEDEERRRRRRERNKVAATKCRNKKKERTGRLAEESESLEVNNNALKNEIHNLEAERNKLMNLLQGHMPNCPMNHPPPSAPTRSSTTTTSYYSHTSHVTSGYTSWSSVSG